MARVDVDTFFFQQRERQVFVRARCGDAQNRIPATFYLEAAANFLQGELTIELRQISADAFHQLFLKRAALREKRGQRQLHWRVH